MLADEDVTFRLGCVPDLLFDAVAPGDSDLAQGLGNDFRTGFDLAVDPIGPVGHHLNVYGASPFEIKEEVLHCV